jgi:tellurite resistance protein TerC
MLNDLLHGQTGAWIGLAITIAVLLALDLLVLRGRGGAMSTKAAAVTSAVWIGLSFAFAGVLLVLGTEGQAAAFLTGYVVEKSLSLDNVFVFLVVFNAFAIPEIRRARLLTHGILLALVLRLAFILVGAAALEHASWLSIPFALLLAWTGWRLWKGRHDHGGEEKLVQGVRSRLRVAEGDHGEALTVRVAANVEGSGAGGVVSSGAEGSIASEGAEGSGGGGGGGVATAPAGVSVKTRRALTAAGATLVAIALVDIIFAVDSVPAILAITTDTFVVFAANAFALLGLRPLFFLVADLVERLYYLKAALALLLVFIAVKMGLSEVVGKVPPQYSLAGVVLILGGGVIASLVRNRGGGGTGATATA